MTGLLDIAILVGCVLLASASAHYARFLTRELKRLRAMAPETRGPDHTLTTLTLEALRAAGLFLLLPTGWMAATTIVDGM